MYYLVLIYGDEKKWADLPPDEAQREYEAYGAYTQELTAAGVARGGAALAPVATATTVRVKGGKATTTDGPFAETKEQLGGYYLIEVPDLDAALKWAGKCPGARHGSVEVRPIGILTKPDGTTEFFQQ
jgi:hypothetical protein